MWFDTGFPSLRHTGLHSSETGVPFLLSSTAVKRAVTREYLGTHYMYMRNIDEFQLNNFLKGPSRQVITSISFTGCRVSSSWESEDWTWCRRGRVPWPCPGANSHWTRKGEGSVWTSIGPPRQLGHRFQIISSSITALCSERSTSPEADAIDALQRTRKRGATANITGLWVAWTMKTGKSAQTGLTGLWATWIIWVTQNNAD